MTKSVLITGACGYLGRELLAAIAAARDDFGAIVAMDVREVDDRDRLPRVEYLRRDVREPDLDVVLRTHGIETVVHLAAIVTPGGDMAPDVQYSVDVIGTRNVLDACIAAGVGQLVITSSGAAYGYHADNPAGLRESDPLRGNDEFAYARNKRLAEEMLADYRARHPALRQLIFRPCAILGDRVANQITDLFEKPFLLGVQGTSTPFVFIWDRDVVACLLKGVREERAGIYNLAGDGVMTLDDIGQRIGKRCIHMPQQLLRFALAALHALRLTQYGPEQVDFVRYRPVLSNAALKEDFGYTPQLTTKDAFERYWRNRVTIRSTGPRLSGQVVAITGAASGIGRALAQRFGGGGARLALLDRDGDEIQQRAAEMRELGVEAVGYRCDVTSMEDCRVAIATVTERFGRIDVLINNAGITHLGAFADTDVAVLRSVMDVNFFGTTNCTKAALEALRRSRGCIVVLSSIAGFAPLAGRAGYAASKHALHGFFNSLRCELGSSNVHVLLACPGFTSTNIGKHALGADGLPAQVPRTTAGAEAPPERVAESIYRATVKRQRQVVLSPTGKLAWIVSRFAPALYDRLMVRALA